MNFIASNKYIFVPNLGYVLLIPKYTFGNLILILWLTKNIYS
jgi:hypothetical protein